MRSLGMLSLLSFLFLVSSSIELDYSTETNVLLTDNEGVTYQLITFANRICVTLAPHWIGVSGTAWRNSAFSYRWMYDPMGQKLMSFTNREICLTAVPERFELSLANCSSSKDATNDQIFNYNHQTKQLLWWNPITKRYYPIYLEKDGGRTVRMVPYLLVKPFISRNHASQGITELIRRFSNSIIVDASNGIALNPRSYRFRALILHSLQTAMPQMSSIEYEKYVELIESLRGPEFGYFMTKHNGYLISDGHSVSSIHWNRLKQSNNHYGLWHVNENNHLIHFLSGKYLQAIPNDKSRNIKKLENMLRDSTIVKESNQAFKMLNNVSNESFYDLKLAVYSKEEHDTFVSIGIVKDRHEMYVNNKGGAQKVLYTMSSHGADAYLAFVDNSTFQNMRRNIWSNVAFANQETGFSRWPEELRRYNGVAFTRF